MDKVVIPKKVDVNELAINSAVVKVCTVDLLG